MLLTSFPGIFNQQSYLCRQVLSTIPSCLISLCSGMTFGITAVMLPQLRKDQTIHYDAAHESWIASISSLSMIIGSLSSGHILDHYGRRIAHIILGLPYVIGWLAIACAPSTAVIIIGRFFTGFSSGANKAVMLVYIGETASPKVRTIALVIPSVLLNVGILLSHIFGYYLDWKISSYICIVPAVMISGSSLFLKESPIWLITKGKTEEGIKIFRWFRGTDDASEAELKTVIDRQSENPKITAKELMKIVCSGAFIKPMLVLLVVMMNIQFSGVSVLSFYSQDIFRITFNGKVDPFIMMVVMDFIVGIVSAVFCFLGKYVSKKKSYLISNFGVSLSIGGLVTCLILGSDNFVWVPLLFLVIFLCFSTAILTIGWTYVPELLPSSARGIGSGLNSAFASISLFSIVKETPDIIKAFGAFAEFTFYGVTSLICGIILCFTLPDTDGKTLQSIEDSYNKRKVENKNDQNRNEVEHNITSL